ncbi:hypothetical protein HK405_013875 [Cladochytrium tenue]|nr:hypothetical protein HK405_013875 [Cladochytrium tenue]
MCDTTNTSMRQVKMYGQNLAGIFGFSHFTGGFPGGQADYVRVPLADNNLLKIPDDVPDEKALFLSDVSVAIWGMGLIGLLTARWCQLLGARPVIAVDRVPERLAFARLRLGCEVVDFAQQADVAGWILEREPRGVDCAVDAAGFAYAKTWAHAALRATGAESDCPEVLQEAVRAVRKFGTVAVVADYVGTANGFPIGAVMEKGVTLRGTGQAPVQRYWRELLEKVRTGEFDPSFIVSHRFDLDEMALLYAAFDRKEHG